MQAKDAYGKKEELQYNKLIDLKVTTKKGIRSEIKVKIKQKEIIDREIDKVDKG